MTTPSDELPSRRRNREILPAASVCANIVELVLAA
jgi:hypothetical protein